jgi:hypothetical protein
MATSVPHKGIPAQAPSKLPPPKAEMRFIKKGLGPDVMSPPPPRQTLEK